MTATAEPMAYIARAACGCLRMAVVVTPESISRLAKEVRAAMRDGLTVEMVTCEYVRTTTWRVPDCETHRRPKQAGAVQPGLGLGEGL